MVLEMMDLSLEEIIKQNLRTKKSTGRSTPKSSTHGQKSTASSRVRQSLGRTKAASVAKPVGRKDIAAARKKNQSIPWSSAMPGRKPAAIGPITIINDRTKPVDAKSKSHKTIKASQSGIIVTVKNDRYGKSSSESSRSRTSDESTRSRHRSRSRDRSERKYRSRSRSRMERLEIKITNEKAIVSPTAAVAENHGIPVVAQPIQVVPSMGINTASQFRTPLAVMDMYTGRYQRPSLEPYRPPPVMQQFFRSLTDATALGHIPTPYMTPLPPASTSMPQNSSNSNVIRKPFD